MADDKLATDWRDPERYEPRECWPKRVWGWEFLRRHKPFRDAWQETVRGAQVQDDGSPLTIVSLEASPCRPFRCLYADAPDIDARQARVLWLPEVSPRVLPMLAVADGQENERLFDLTSLDLRALLLRESGLQHLLLQDGPRALQLVVRGADILRPMRLYPEAPLAGQDRDAYFMSLRCWTEFLESGRLGKGYFGPDRRHRRLSVVARALDGLASGAKHRDIAAVLCGEKRVAGEWSDPQSPLHDYVRHTLRRGRQLMDGAYVQFLR